MNALLKTTIRLGLRGTGLYRRGMRNALAPEAHDVELALERLPAAFDGYRVLHLSDLHLGLLPGGAERIGEIAAAMPADLCVMTGDYQPSFRAAPDQVVAPMGVVAGAIAAPDGILAVLGNHDDRSLADTLPPLGIEVLVNRGVALRRGGAALHVIGVQDRTYRVLSTGRAALARVPAGFTVALVHSPRYAALAAEAGIDLYLCGHTHGGQICLPGGRAVYVPRGAARRRVAGPWRYGRMIGYTSRGAGVSGVPVRFNCRGEVVRFTLRRGAGAAR